MLRCQPDDGPKVAGTPQPPLQLRPSRLTQLLAQLVFASLFAAPVSAQGRTASRTYSFHLVTGQPQSGVFELERER